MTTLGNLDTNGIGRYVESTTIGTEFSDYMNAGLESVSSVIGAKANHAVVAFASGVITAQSIISIEGLTGFDEYEIVLDLPTASAANTFTAQLLNGTTPDATASAYDRQDMVGATTTVSGANLLAQTSWAIAQPGARTDKHLTLVLYGLNAARRTIVETRVRAFDATANPGVVLSALRHRPASAFNGIRLTTSTGTVTGTYAVKATRYA